MVALIFYTKSYPFLNIPFRWEFLKKLTIVVKFINFEKATKFKKNLPLRFDIYIAGNINSKVKSGRYFFKFCGLL